VSDAAEYLDRRAIFAEEFMLRVWPCTVKQAAAYVAKHHRHLPGMGGAMFAAALGPEPGEWWGVGTVGCGAQEWEGTGRAIITRTATDGAHNGCSMLLGALARAAKALGYVEVWTYTLPEEPGTSLRAAGFVDMGFSDGGEHHRESRPRRAAVRPDEKRRWRRVLSDVEPWPSTACREKAADPQLSFEWSEDAA
jgi:hypothetical protein